MVGASCKIDAASIRAAKNDPIEEANWKCFFDYFKFAVHLLGQQNVTQ